MSKQADCNRKGRRFEEAVAQQLRALWSGAEAAGVKTQRRPGKHRPDVDGTPFWVECERSAKPRPFRKYQQAVLEGAEDGRPILVVSERDDRPGQKLVTMTLEQFQHIMCVLHDSGGLPDVAS